MQCHSICLKVSPRVWSRYFLVSSIEFSNIGIDVQYIATFYLLNVSTDLTRFHKAFRDRCSPWRLLCTQASQFKCFLQGKLSSCSLIIVYWLLRYIDVTIGEVQWAACCADADVPGKEPGYVWLLHFLGMLRCSGLLGAGQPSVAGHEVSLEVVTNQDTLRLHTNHNPTSTLAPSIFL